MDVRKLLKQDFLSRGKILRASKCTLTVLVIILPNADYAGKNALLTYFPPLFSRYLLEWYKAKEVIVEIHMLRQLPIFLNVAGEYVTPDQNSSFILPNEETEEIFTRSKWNELLEPLFPSHILSCANPEDRELLTLALIQPISEQRLVTHFLIRHVDELPESVCIRILKTVYKFQPWRSRELTVSLLDPLIHLRLVILPTGIYVT